MPVELRSAVSVRVVAGLSACAMVVLVVVALIENTAVRLMFSASHRLSANFSPTLLKRDITEAAHSPDSVVFLGDSVIWGYLLPASATAVAQLQADGIDARNLSFKASSAPNSYVIARLLLEAGGRPRAIVIEVNQKTLNDADNAYQTLHPAVATLAPDVLSASDRALVSLKAPASTFASRCEAMLSAASLFYAMRSDIHDRLYGDSAAAPPTPTTPDAFEGTYDLAPLDETNVGVHFLEETARLLAEARIPVIALFVPTNHHLLHEYIDNPQYRANERYLRHIFARYNERILDLDAAFPANDFFDNDHLTASGQQRLAQALKAAIQS